jgi:hypothetical protein
VRRRSRGGWIALVVVALAAVGLVAAHATGRLMPWLHPITQKVTPIVEKVTPILQNLAPSSSSDIDAGPPPDASASMDASVVQHKQAAPLSSAQLGAPLVRGEFVTACNAPSTMKVVVKVKVQKGRAIDSNVATDPPDTTVSRCIDDAIHQLRWDISPKAQHLTVRY